MNTPAVPAGVGVRRSAIDQLVRISEGGGYANLVVKAALDRSEMDTRDKAFVAELVYGTTRMRRACRHLISRHRDTGVAPRVQAALDVGAYQLAFAHTPAHAAVDTTVAASPRPARGLVNAVLRRIAVDVADGVDWPDVATQLSYPDWIVDEMTARLGDERGRAALETMNLAATTHTRDDGYVQDPASQFVVEAVAAAAGERVLDLCAAPGGKATGIAAAGAEVVAADVTPTRSGLIAANARRLDADLDAGLDAGLGVIAADGRRAPFADDTFDRVLVDAPCSGLGVLRRRADARWRMDADGPQRLARLQDNLLDEAFRVTREGGTVIYAVCTLTRDENDGVADRVSDVGDGRVETLRHTVEPTATSDGMFVCSWRNEARS